MESHNHITKLAQVLVQYSLGIKEKEKVIITGSTASELLLKEIYKELILAGAHTSVHMEFQDRDYLFYKLAQEFQIRYTDPFDLYEIENADAIIQLMPDFNPHELTSIDPEKKRENRIARKPIMETFIKRSGDGSLRWVTSMCPTPALAQEAHMSLDEYSEFVFSCMKLNADDPIALWKDLSEEQERICDLLDRVKAIRYVGQDTDLRFRCDGRKWINCDGKENFPDGEIFTGPIEDSVEGTIRFTYPAIYMGSEIEDIFLRFEKGRVVEARAAKGEELLLKLLDVDKNARYVGEIAIGTNYNIDRFTKNMLLDEKMGGHVHLALGTGFPESGSNNISAIHWDILKDMREGGEIYADEKLIYENGVFLKIN